MPRYRRGIFLINKPFQLRFSLYVAAWVLVGTLIYPFVISYVFDYANQLLTAASADPGLSAGLLTVRREVMATIIFVELLFIALTFVASIFISHRIAGPLYKLSRAFGTASQGLLHDDLQFRTRDQFKDLADDYNIMVRGLREIVETRSDAILETEAKLKKLVEKANPELKPELQSLIARLSSVHASAIVLKE